MITLSPRQAGLLARLDHAIHSDGCTGMLARDGDNAWYLSDTLWIRMPSPHVDMPGVRILPWSHIERTAARRNGARPLRLDKPDAWVEPADPIRLPDPTFAPLRPPRDQGAADTGLTHMTVLKGGRHGRPAWLILPKGMLRGLASIVLLNGPSPRTGPRKGQSTLPHDPATGLPEGMR